MVNGVGTGHLHRIQWIGNRLQVPPREVQINYRVPELDVTEQELNGTQVGTRF
jgi:hypothetical protein